jgi:hypothetical protein
MIAIFMHCSYRLVRLPHPFVRREMPELFKCGTAPIAPALGDLAVPVGGGHAGVQLLSQSLLKPVARRRRR